jgi:hypothetical protein
MPVPLQCVFKSLQELRAARPRLLARRDRDGSFDVLTQCGLRALRHSGKVDGLQAADGFGRGLHEQQ